MFERQFWGCGRYAPCRLYTQLIAGGFFSNENTPDLLLEYGSQPGLKDFSRNIDAKGFTVQNDNERLNARLYGSLLLRNQTKGRNFRGYDWAVPVYKVALKKSTRRLCKYLVKGFGAASYDFERLSRGVLCLQLCEQAMRMKKLKPFIGYRRFTAELLKEYQYHGSTSRLVNRVTGFPSSRNSMDVVGVIAMYSRTYADGGFVAEWHGESSEQVECPPHFVVRRNRNDKYYIYFRAPDVADRRYDDLPWQGIEIGTTQDISKVDQIAKSFITAVVLHTPRKSVSETYMNTARKALKAKYTGFVPVPTTHEASANELHRVAIDMEGEAMRRAVECLKRVAAGVAEEIWDRGFTDAQFAETFNRLSPQWMGKLRLTTSEEMQIRVETGAKSMLALICNEECIAPLKNRWQSFASFVKHAVQYLRFLKSLRREFAELGRFPEDIAKARGAMNRFVFTENTND